MKVVWVKDKFKEVLSKERDKEDLFTLDVPAGLRKELEEDGTPRKDKLVEEWIGPEDMTTLSNVAEGSGKRTLAIIPCFNEEATIGSVVLKARRYVDEVVVVDDGSVDNTAKVAEYAGATVISHGGNRGYGAAIQSCFEYARKHEFDIMTILDGDGQHNAD